MHLKIKFDFFYLFVFARNTENYKINYFQIKQRKYSRIIKMFIFVYFKQKLKLKLKKKRNVFVKNKK